jgi:hypothetical protein
MTDTFNFVGDFRFTETDAHLEFRIPMRVLRTFINGPSSRLLYIQRHEIVGLLRIIEANPKTPAADLAIARSLLKKA